MRDVTATAASRAWLAVALLGAAVVAFVLASGLTGRLDAGQRAVETLAPALTEERLAGTRGGVAVLSGHVELIDALLTREGGTARDARELIVLMRRRMGLSSEQVRRILRREAPRVEALTRALPLDAAAAEVPTLTAFLAARLSLTGEDAAGLLEQGFPGVASVLTGLRDLDGSWRDVPGIDGLTRLSRDKPVRTVPGLRKYVRDDLVPRLSEHGEEVRDAALAGGIGYLPWALIGIGIALVVLGAAGARLALGGILGRPAWVALAGAGLVLIAAIATVGLLPRLEGAQRAAAGLEPVLQPPRAVATVAGLDTVGVAIAFGDPLMTAAGGGARDARRLYRLLAERTVQRPAQVRGEVRRRAPRTVALLEAAPLDELAGEVDPLLDYLRRALGAEDRDELLATLRRRVPRLTRALLMVGDVSRRWTAVPGSDGMTRLDGVTPVRAMPELAAYLRDDLGPLLLRGHDDVARLRAGVPLGALGPALLCLGIVLMILGSTMVQFVRRA